jgi:hypothetical protein
MLFIIWPSCDAHNLSLQAWILAELRPRLLQNVRGAAAGAASPPGAAIPAAAGTGLAGITGAGTENCARARPTEPAGVSIQTTKHRNNIDDLLIGRSPARLNPRELSRTCCTLEQLIGIKNARVQRFC